MKEIKFTVAEITVNRDRNVDKSIVVFCLEALLIRTFYRWLFYVANDDKCQVEFRRNLGQNQNGIF